MNTYSNDRNTVVEVLKTQAWTINGTATNGHQSTSPATWEQQVNTSGDLYFKMMKTLVLKANKQFFFLQHLLQTLYFSCV